MLEGCSPVARPLLAEARGSARARGGPAGGDLAKHKAKTFVACPICGNRTAAMGMPLHCRRWHPDIPWTEVPRNWVPWSDAQAQQEERAPEADIAVQGAPAQPRQAAQARATQYQGMIPGAVLTVTPRAFTITSNIIFQAMEVTIRKWGWPQMDPGKWLDTFLYLAMRDYGYILFGVLEVDENGNPLLVEQGPSEPDGNGDNEAILEDELEELILR